MKRYAVLVEVTIGVEAENEEQAKEKVEDNLPALNAMNLEVTNVEELPF